MRLPLALCLVWLGYGTAMLLAREFVVAVTFLGLSAISLGVDVVAR